MFLVVSVLLSTEYKNSNIPFLPWLVSFENLLVFKGLFRCLFTILPDKVLFCSTSLLSSIVPFELTSSTKSQPLNSILLFIVLDVVPDSFWVPK